MYGVLLTRVVLVGDKVDYTILHPRARAQQQTLGAPQKHLNLIKS